jgi:predicted HNH restriction endonuclease
LAIKPKKKTRKKPVTPASTIKSALGTIWLRSRERAEAVRLAGNTCQCCNKKGNAAKGREVVINVHHLEGAEWDKIIAYIRRVLLVDPSKLAVVCKSCHDELHETGEF